MAPSKPLSLCSGRPRPGRRRPASDRRSPIPPTTRVTQIRPRPNGNPDRQQRSTREIFTSHRQGLTGKPPEGSTYLADTTAGLGRLIAALAAIAARMLPPIFVRSTLAHKRVAIWFFGTIQPLTEICVRLWTTQFSPALAMGSLRDASVSEPALSKNPRRSLPAACASFLVMRWPSI